MPHNYVGRGKLYTDDYKRQCFDAWFLAGRPNAIAQIKDVLPASIRGNKPSSSMIRRWMVNENWNERADELDAKAMILADDSVISRKAEIIKLHQEKAAELAAKAHSFLMSEGFDSSAAAVNAYFKSTEEVRKMASFSDLLEKLGAMNDDDVMKEIINRINRGSENDQIVDSVEGEEVDVDEETEEE